MSEEVTEIERRPIKGYPDYAVDANGNVWSKRVPGPQGRKPREDWRKLSPQRSRRSGVVYRTVGLRQTPGGRKQTRLVHRLILEAFVGPCPKGMVACHNDGDPSNNRLDNLRWGTLSENAADKFDHGTLVRGSQSYKAKHSEMDILTVFFLRRLGLSDKAILEFVDLGHPGNVSAVLRGATWPHVRKLFKAVKAMAAAFRARGRGRVAKKAAQTGYQDEETASE